jgi:hypothetical protein
MEGREEWNGAGHSGHTDDGVKNEKTLLIIFLPWAGVGPVFGLSQYDMLDCEVWSSRHDCIKCVYKAKAPFGSPQYGQGLWGITKLREAVAVLKDTVVDTERVFGRLDTGIQNTDTVRLEIRYLLGAILPGKYIPIRYRG